MNHEKSGGMMSYRLVYCNRRPVGNGTNQGVKIGDGVEDECLTKGGAGAESSNLLDDSRILYAVLKAIQKLSKRDSCDQSCDAHEKVGEEHVVPPGGSLFHLL